MIFTYFGIILFLSVEWVKFIADSPVKRAERSYRSGKYGIPHQCLRSRHPE
nr:MAG TPA: hypothetical protein [Bacteriophage sp.]